MISVDRTTLVSTVDAFRSDSDQANTAMGDQVLFLRKDGIEKIPGIDGTAQLWARPKHGGTFPKDRSEPFLRNLVKIEREWQDKIDLLGLKAGEETTELGAKHRKQRQALVKRLRAVREAVKASTPLNGRLQTMRASRDNLQRLGRAEEADKVRRRLEPLEKAFWAKIMAEAGVTERAKRERDLLLATQQIELGDLRRALRRDIEGAKKARDTDIKAQRRRNGCSSDDVWSIWFAAKTGDTSRLLQILSAPESKVDARDPDTGWTALHFASRQGKLEAVDVLLREKASVVARAPEGRTPLHFAAGWGTYQVCLALLQAGADKTLLDRDGATALHLAESKQRGKIASVLDAWRPIGLTATQTNAIIDSKEEQAPRPWESEDNPTIRAQLRVLDMKTATFGDKHHGLRVTLGKLADMCKSAGRLEDSRRHLEQLLQLLQSSTKMKSATTSPRSAVDLTVVLGNLGVVCHDMGDGDRARELLESALKAAASVICDQTSRHVVDAVTRNLGLHYLKEGRVEEARSLFRTWVERRENEIRSDMPGGHESLLMIEPLELLSYADMLAGDHIAAATGAEHARSIADIQHKYRGAEADRSTVETSSGDVEPVLLSALSKDEAQLADPVPRLEWLGLQRFMAGEHAEAADFFSKARARELLQQKQHRNLQLGQGDGQSGDCLGQSKTRSKGVKTVADNVHGGTEVKSATDDGEFSSEAMRLDRCAAVAICRKGPEAF